MGKNSSKRKQRTEYSRMSSIMAKLDNQLKAEKESGKRKKPDKNENSPIAVC